jgi:Protein of unknown function (DUF3306)
MRLIVAALIALVVALALVAPASAYDPETLWEQKDLDALTAQSDFTVFMREDVPEDVRKLALRRLWTLMNLPVSCDDLCLDVERVPDASGE